MAKKVLSILMIFGLMCCSISYADVVGLMYGHNGPTPIFYEFSWAICCAFFFIIIWCILKILKKDTKKFSKIFITVFFIGAILTFLVSLAIISNDMHNKDIADWKVSINKTRAELYNSRYKVYEGINKSASETRLFINLVNHHNNEEKTEEYGEFIISGDYTTTDKIQVGKYYSIIDFTYDELGVLTGCTIKQQDDFVEPDN